MINATRLIGKHVIPEGSHCVGHILVMVSVACLAQALRLGSDIDSCRRLGVDIIETQLSCIPVHIAASIFVRQYAGARLNEVTREGGEQRIKGVAVDHGHAVMDYGSGGTGRHAMPRRGSACRR